MYAATPSCSCLHYAVALAQLRALTDLSCYSKMKFTGAIAIALAAVPSVFAAAIAEPALQVRAFGSEIVTSINKVNASLAALDAQIQKVNSADLTQLLAVNSAANDLSTVISTETTNVNSQAVVDIFGALNIQIATNGLISGTQQVSKDIIAIKQYVVQAGVEAVVLQTLQSQKAGADKFGAAIASKIPSDFQFIAQLDQQQVDTALTNAINAYSS